MEIYTYNTDKHNGCKSPAHIKLHVRDSHFLTQVYNLQCKTFLLGYGDAYIGI